MIRIDRNSAVPLYEQIKSSVRALLRQSLLKEGDVLPQPQALAEKLVISPAIVQRSYTELQKEGILNGEYRIAANAAIDAEKSWQEAYQNLVESLQASRRSGLDWEQIQKLVQTLIEAESGKSTAPVSSKPVRGQCPYCRQKIDVESEIVLCIICKTAHHEECWKETGRCSIFGCSGRIHFPK